MALSLVLTWLLPACASEPFLRLRDATLGYHGAEDDCTNLTEIGIGWFGPTNLDDPLTGDLWWAANLAVREANEQRAAPPERGVHAASPSELTNAPACPDPLSTSTGKRPEGRAPTPPGDSPFVIRHSSFHALRFRLVPRWAVDPWGTGVSQLARMVYDEQPLALLGSVDSASTHLAEQVVAKANLPLVSPIATDKSVTLAGVSWMFSCAPSDAAIARALVEDILTTLKTDANRLALLATTDHETRMTAREVVKELSRHGHTAEFRFDVPPGAHAIAQQMSALEASHPAAVLIIAGAEDAARLAQAVKSRMPDATLFGSQSFGRQRFLELAGQAAEGVRFPLLFVSDATDKIAARFMARCLAERGRLPDYTAALTYDATRLLLEAIRRAGPNRARIREALAHGSPWPGLAGPIRFDGTGQNTETHICLGTIRHGSIMPLALGERPHRSEP